MTDGRDEKRPGERAPEPQNVPVKKNKKKPTPLHPHINEERGEKLFATDDTKETRHFSPN